MIIVIEKNYLEENTRPLFFKELNLIINSFASNGIVDKKSYTPLIDTVGELCLKVINKFEMKENFNPVVLNCLTIGRRDLNNLNQMINDVLTSDEFSEEDRFKVSYVKMNLDFLVSVFNGNVNLVS